MKQVQKIAKKSYRQKLLATSIAAACTAMVATSITQASDIDIYQEAKSGDITLMLMLDISTSMNGGQKARDDFGLSTSDCSGSSSGNSTLPNYGYSRTYCTVTAAQLTTLSNGNATNKAKAEKIRKACNKQANNNYFCGDRTARMKDAVYELLNGNTDKGITKLDDTKVVGLSTFGHTTNSDYAEGAILLPARSLGTVVGTKTHRQLLTEKVQALTGRTYTPTAFGYAEVINYLMGKRPATNSLSRGFNNSDSSTKTGSGYNQRYESPASLAEQEEDLKRCSGQGIYVLTDGMPNSKNSLTQDNMRIGLGLGSGSFSCNTGNNWDCQHKGAVALMNKQNPLSLEVRTAVIGFGSDFEISGVSYDRQKSQQDNIDALNPINTDPKNAAYWGIIGGGGWYSGSSSQDVVDSVNDFMDSLGTDIPSVTTGSPVIPKDALNPAALQNDAYYQQFQPTPDKEYSLWVGNLKKYVVGSSGKLQGRSNQNVTDSRGRLVTPTYDTNGKLTSAVYDFWSYPVNSNAAIADGDENTIGSRKFAAKGGAWSQLKLRTESNIVQRKLVTNRIGSGAGIGATFTGSSDTLRTVNLNYLTDATYKDDPNRGYLISLLGYNVDAANPSSITTSSLASAAEFRQVGAVMHSLPVLVTNKGKVAYDASTKQINTTNREDYILFGTTQGLLHVVDQTNGEEKFAFVPNEMVENQKAAFLNYTSTTGGVNNLYYGIDGPWALHTEYVLANDSTGNLTVGTGKGIGQKGKQLAFGGLRMGGRSYYSLDLINIDSPKLNFHINPDGDTSGPLSYMGQSWSKPAIGYVNWGGRSTMVMFVGGGYDMGYENPEYNPTIAKGAGVYMFSAEDVKDSSGTIKIKAGELLWWASTNATSSDPTANTGTIGRKDANLKHSVVSEIRTVDRDGDDLVDNIYFGDLGGQLFRIDFDNKAKTLGTFSKAPVRLLNLNKSGGKSPRFYDMPSFSVYDEKGTTFAAISVGSGNRSKPLHSYTTGTSGVNYDSIYTVYDKDVARRDLFTTATLNTQNVTMATLGEVTNNNRIDTSLLDANGKLDHSKLIAPYLGKDGWYYQFQNCVKGSDGSKAGCSDYKMQSEKVFGTPLAMNYRLYVSTFDSSKPGMSGDCGAGVKGESFLTTFCMPYGQCASAADASVGGTGGGSNDPDERGLPIGIGIQNPTPGGCTGTSCGGGPSMPFPKVETASNYCASTGGRMIVTTTGLGGGTGEAVQVCLIPQRWYEKVIPTRED